MHSPETNKRLNDEAQSRHNYAIDRVAEALFDMGYVPVELVASASYSELGPGAKETYQDAARSLIRRYNGENY